MSRHNPQHGANMVDRYIGSAFDIVYAVYQQLDKFPLMYEFAESMIPNIEKILEDNAYILPKIDELDAAILLAQNSATKAEDEANRAEGEADRAQSIIDEYNDGLTAAIEAYAGADGAKLIGFGSKTVDDALNENIDEINALRSTFNGIYSFYPKDSAGELVEATITVYDPEENLAVLTDPLDQPLTNPFTVTGLAAFKAAPGTYELRVTIAGTTTVSTIQFLDSDVRKDLTPLINNKLSKLASAGAANGMPAGYISSPELNQTQIYFRGNEASVGVAANAVTIHIATSNNNWGRLRVDPVNNQAWIQGGNAQTGDGWTNKIVFDDDERLYPTTTWGKDFATSEDADEALTKLGLNTVLTRLQDIEDLELQQTLADIISRLEALETP